MTKAKLAGIIYHLRVKAWQYKKRGDLINAKLAEDTAEEFEKQLDKMHEISKDWTEDVYHEISKSCK